MAENDKVKPVKESRQGICQKGCRQDGCKGGTAQKGWQKSR